MANSITKDLRKKSNAELAELITKCKQQLLEIRFNVANGEAEKLHVISGIKKTIARSLTILNERALEQQAQAQNKPEDNEKQTTTKKKGTK